MSTILCSVLLARFLPLLLCLLLNVESLFDQHLLAIINVFSASDRSCGATSSVILVDVLLLLLGSEESVHIFLSGLGRCSSLIQIVHHFLVTSLLAL